MQPRTLFLTVSLLDRYLAITASRRQELQLVGVASILIASKFEEIHPPELKDFVYLTNNAYTMDQTRSMECRMLNALDFRISCSTVADFLRPLQTAMSSAKHQQLAAYLSELSLLELDMLQYHPSHVAAAA